ncbi:MAG: F-box/LRR-repeat protein 13-like [Planctomycetaceae bacterium]|nr:F-box/LRR-repeat protein 13-like [Planctomycetaceae bacterium]
MPKNLYHSAKSGVNSCMITAKVLRWSAGVQRASRQILINSGIDNMRRVYIVVATVAFGFLGGCSKSPQPPATAPSAASATQPVPVVLPEPSGDVAMVESPQPTVSAEEGPAANPTVAPTAAPVVTPAESSTSVELKQREIGFDNESADGISYQIMAPPNPDPDADTNQRSMTVYGGPHFNLQVELGSYDFKAFVAGLRDTGEVTVVDEKPDSLIIKKNVPDPVDPDKMRETHAVYLNRTEGYREFRIYSLEADEKSKVCIYSLNDVQRMLQSGSKFVLTKPLPTDPAELCEKLHIELRRSLTFDEPERKEFVLAELPDSNIGTDSMLPLLLKFPSLIAVDAGSSPNPEPGKYDIKGSSWSVLAKLPQLRHLDFRSRDASDEAIAMIAQITQLKKLGIGHWTLNIESIAPLEKLQALEELQINAGKVTDLGLDKFPLLPKLRDLAIEGQDVTAESLTGVGLRRLALLPQLRILQFSAEPLGDAGFEELGKLTSLEDLFVSCDDVTEEGISHLKSLVNLRKLTLSSEKISDAEVAHLSSLTNLKSLDIGSPQITDAGLAHLKPLTNLEVLDLTYSKITDAGLSHLRHFNKLKELRLIQTGITSAGIESIVAHKQLEILMLSRTKITAKNVEKLGTLKSLKQLYLEVEPPLGEAIVAKLKAALPKCHVFAK